MSEAFLADTHVLLWSVMDNPRLSRRHREILASDAIVHASAASLWEISIKQSRGRLDAPGDLASLLPRMRFLPLAITLEHAQAVAQLPFHHGDPFDRMLVAQAGIEGLTLMTVDERLAAYGVALA